MKKNSNVLCIFFIITNIFHYNYLFSFLTFFKKNKNDTIFPLYVKHTPKYSFENNIFNKRSYTKKILAHTFSPKGGITKKICSEIHKTNHSIDIAIFSFTSKPIEETLIKAAKRNVKIRIIIDAKQRSKYTKIDRLSKYHNADIYLRKKNKGCMHCKFLILDKKILGFGSFNFSNAGEEDNDEHFSCTNDKDSILYFQKKFNIIKNNCQNYKIIDD